jgi:hypothetical protein
MQSRNWILVMPLAILFVLQATASYGQGIHSGRTRTLSGGSDVYSKETVRVRIRTGDTGHANLHHNDINLSVGPQSSVHLEKNVYDFGLKSYETVAVQATRGSLRFAMGLQGGGAYQIKTPYGTFGDRSFNVANPTELRNSRQASQRGPKTIAKSEKAIAVKKESPNAATAIKRPTVKPKTVAVAAEPTAAKPRSETEPAEEKANSRTITEPDVTASVQPSATSIPVPNKATTTIGAKTEGPASDQPAETSGPVPKKEPTTIAGRTEDPASDQLPETVLKKAKITVAAKMEDPASVEFVDMKRAVNKIGQTFEIICGHVIKGKKKSGEAVGESPFLYLVKEDEAFIVGSNPDSMAAIAYRAHCISPQR